MRPTRNAAATRCPVEAALSVVGGVWKALILFALFDGRKRFSDIRRLLPGATDRTLTLSLRELEADGILLREVHAQIPLRVTYELTEFGFSLEPLLAQLNEWGAGYVARNGDRP